MKISYLITCSSESDTLSKLLEVIGGCIRNGNDECIIVIDKDTRDNKKTLSLLKEFASTMSYEIVEKKTCKIIEHSLNNDYGSHKNAGIERCSGEFIFQIDGDEMPPESLLGENLHMLIDGNPTIEAYAIPRINDFRGVSEENARQWGWKLDNSPTYGRPRINFPDYQWRIFKNVPNIRFQKRLHERIEGFKTYSILPAEEMWAIYHDKTIEKQIETNLRYNKDFTTDENMGKSIK